MQADFFQQQVERLRKVYSPVSMNEERTKVLWERFKDVPNHVFENAVNYLIGEFTTQALPSISRFAEAVGLFRTNPSGASWMQEMLPAHSCDACRDFGYGFVGDTLVACTCASGRRLAPQELVKQQANYDRGKVLLPNRAALPAFLHGEGA